MKYSSYTVSAKEAQREKAESDALIQSFEENRDFVRGRTMRADNYLDRTIHGHGHTLSRIVWDDKHAYHRRKRKPIRGRVEAWGINLFSGPSVRENVRSSLKIAYDIATTEYNERNSSELFGELYVTRDGTMDRSKVRGKMRANVLYLNTLFADFRLRNEFVGLVPAVEEWYRGESTEKSPLFRMPLHIMSLPSGSVVRQAAAIRSIIHENNIHVLILNSFEFACTDSRQKNELVYLLKDLCEEMKLTLVVCTTEPLPEFGKRGRTRGAIAGLIDLCAQQGAIEYSIEDYANALAAGRDVKQLANGATAYHVSDIVLKKQSPPPLPLEAYVEEDLEGLGMASPSIPMPNEERVDTEAWQAEPEGAPRPAESGGAPPIGIYGDRFGPCSAENESDDDLEDDEFEDEELEDEDPDAYIYDKNHPPSAWGRDDLEEDEEAIIV